LTIFLLALNALNSWYYVIYCGLISLAMLFWPTTSRTNKSFTIHNPNFAIRHYLIRAGRITLVLLLALLILSPLLLPMFQLLGTTTLVGEHNPLRHSVDLFSLWVPGPPSTWSSWFEDVWISYAAHQREPGASAYLGYIGLGLSLIALFSHRWRRQVIWWWVVALGFTLLAMGPQLQIDGQILDIPLPYHLLARLIPAFAITGIPGRFVVMTGLALAMLAAYGLATLTRRLAEVKGWGSRGSRWLWLAAALLITLEYLAIPIRLTPTDLDDFYHTMASDTDSYAILDIKWDANFLLHAQTVHRKPLVGGWLARLPEPQAAYLNQGGLDESFLYLLLGPEGKTLSDPAAIQAALQAALAEREVRYIIDHDHVAGPFLKKFLGWPVVYERDEIVVYGADD
jgi:hypothetical protein